MSHFFCIRIEFLLERFHGRDDSGEPEWPPSPLRVFQALTAACAGSSNERVEIRRFADALRWLEQQSPPEVFAPVARRAEPYRLYVPNNSGDLAAASWAAHKEKDLSAFRTEKDIHPMALPAGAPLHYVWRLESRAQEGGQLIEAAGAISCLGWGIDQVAADACWLSEAEVANLPGLRYRPVDNGGSRRMRLPVHGTFEALTARHQASLTRLRMEGGKRLLVPVPRLTTWSWKGYSTARDPQSPPTKVFALRPTGTDTTARFQSFEPARQTTVVSAMVRGQLLSEDLTRNLGWNNERLAMLHGHGEQQGDSEHKPTTGPRVAIVPLPSNEYRGGERGWSFGSTRRLMLTMLKGHDDEAFADIGYLLNGRTLIPQDDKSASALLVPMEADPMVRDSYLNHSSEWATVTPVILPGHEDRKRHRAKLAAHKSTLTAQQKNNIVDQLDARIEALLRKAVMQAGFDEELAMHAEIEWRGTGYFPGVAMSSAYFVPKHLQRFTRYHVRIRWRDAAGVEVQVPGPVLLGGGRFVGMGLFARY